MSDESVWEETFNIIKNILGLQANPISQKGSKSNPIRKDMFRLDLSHKGPGWLGNIPMTGEKEGWNMSELSVGAPGSEEGFFPLLVPLMPQGAVDNLAAGGEATPQDFERARLHAKYMRKHGKGPFAPGGYKHEEDFERTHPATPRKLERINEGYLPGDLDSELRKRNIASDDPGQLGAIEEVYRRPRQRGDK